MSIACARIKPNGIQQIDSMMVELAENLFGLPVHAVIEGGKHIEQQERGSIYAEADDLPWITLKRRQYYQHHQTGKRRRRTDSVADAVESFTLVHSESRGQIAYALR